MKKCFKCKTVKPLTEFYRHPAMADGFLGKCKNCAKRDVRLRRTENIAALREYDRNRAELPHRRKQSRRICDRWHVQHPGRRAAQTRTQRAVVQGLIAKPATCEGCGKETKVEGHHHDYSKPLVVVWLCKPCHAIADKIRRKFEAA